MQLFVSGAAGFLGSRVIEAILAKKDGLRVNGRQAQLKRLIAFDVVEPPDFGDSRVQIRSGNLTDAAQVADLVDADTDVVLHFAAVVSGQAEADFELGMAVNFDATRSLLERLRKLGSVPVFLTTSSVAVFGGALPASVPDKHVWQPQSSYGTQKALVDLLLADYTRRGFIHGRSLRMPTIAVRPGKPNLAASSFASSIIREPLAGQDAVCPVDPKTLLWLMSPQLAVENILHGMGLDQDSLGGQPVLNMPGLSVTVAQMLAALGKLAGPEVAARVSEKPDVRIQAIVNSWPGHFSAEQASVLGFKADLDVESIVRAHQQTVR
ncbi:D-erythronate dehydrogenase [Pseudomonas huanghezhanensis]|uniref:D-erythronate dehydrogenase n=1 Tax=Pseudomonas huanghezhanensis TaxID=3002903 RepID=UPI002286391C|nr:D-erythronate dehydrogenase [Pseudomonas sp. BSw22131]